MSLLMKLQKAKIDIMKESPGADPKVTETMEVMFNPTDLEFNNGVKLSQKKGIGEDNSKQQYVSGANDTLRIKLTFDTYSSIRPEALKVSVKTLTDKFYNLTEKVEEDHQSPLIQFRWGDIIFLGKLTGITQRFTMFTYKGVPVRAELTLTIVKQGGFLKKPFSSPDRTKRHVISGNEQLWQLADQEYDDFSLWRSIADSNGIDNPRALKGASQLKIPSI